MSRRIYRVVVRGQFADLTADQRAALLAEAHEHEIFRSAYTADGTFTYERNLVAFSFRYEVRAEGDDPEALAANAIETATAAAVTNLDAWGLGHKHLRATATDMATMWE